MDSETRVKLLDKPMTRRDFLQFTASSMLILFGLSNFIAFINHTKKIANEPEEVIKRPAGFGSRRFGV